MPHIRTQVPSPLVGEACPERGRRGKGEGAYGNTTTGQALTPTLSRFVGEGERGYNYQLWDEADSFFYDVL